jgi:hypothetical protein
MPTMENLPEFNKMNFFYINFDFVKKSYQYKNNLKSSTSTLDKIKNLKEIIFDIHPLSINETYMEHMGHSLYYSLKTLFVSFVFLIHSVFPILYTDKGSELIKDLYEDLKDRKDFKPNECLKEVDNRGFIDNDADSVDNDVDNDAEGVDNDAEGVDNDVDNDAEGVDNVADFLEDVFDNIKETLKLENKKDK